MRDLIDRSAVLAAMKRTADVYQNLFDKAEEASDYSRMAVYKAALNATELAQGIVKDAQHCFPINEDWEPKIHKPAPPP